MPTKKEQEAFEKGFKKGFKKGRIYQLKLDVQDLENKPKPEEIQQTNPYDI